MFNFDGQIVAGVITADGLGQTFNEILASRREAKRNSGPTEQDYCDLLNGYNQLVARFNRLVEENKKVDSAHAAFTTSEDLRHAEISAQQDQRIQTLQTENAEIRHTLMLADKATATCWAALCEARQKLRDAGLPE